MTTIVINENTKMGKLVMTIIKETNCGKKIQDKKKDRKECDFPHTPNAKTIEALNEAKDRLRKKIRN